MKNNYLKLKYINNDNYYYNYN